MRKAGVLLPISSIPSKYGIGTFGKESYRFVDFLKEAGQSYWQILPLGPTGYGDSPYQSFSTFAGNPYYIDLEMLIEEGLLTAEDCESCDWGGSERYIDYEKMYLSRFKVLKTAWKAAVKKGLKESREYRDFVKDNAWWLDDFALYMSVKDSFGGTNYQEWDSDIRLRKPAAMAAYKEKLAAEIDFYCFQQYEFLSQWLKLKDYANKNGIQIIGDIPIYVAMDGADTWADPQLFQFDREGQPVGVAGCPPDDFAVTGQLWGNPIYDWDYHKKTGYAWWIKRVEYCFRLYDVVRIDHFRGFDEYWFVPYGDETAAGGHWTKGPGYDLFDAIKKALGRRKIIAEDLGFMTDSVHKLVARTGFPNMKIIQFGLYADSDSEYLPHNYGTNCVVYTGTHDNDTNIGWMSVQSRKNLKFARDYLKVRKNKDLPAGMVIAALSCTADMAIIPIQDYLLLGSEARINTPSTLGTNWKWRLDKDDLGADLAGYMFKNAKMYGRV